MCTKIGDSSVERESFFPLVSAASRAVTRFSFSNRKLGAMAEVLFFSSCIALVLINLSYFDAL
jgi:hypothetical protein